MKMEDQKQIMAKVKKMHEGLDIVASVITKLMYLFGIYLYYSLAMRPISTSFNFVRTLTKIFPSKYPLNSKDTGYVGLVKRFKASVTGNHSLKKIKFRAGDWNTWTRQLTNTMQYVTKMKNVTFTGAHILTTKGPKIVFEHLNDNIGMMHALFTRQLNTGLKPDPIVIDDFRKHSEPILEKLIEKINHYSDLLALDVKKELAECFAYSAEKKKKYFSNCMKTLSRNTPWNGKIDRHFYKAMVKVGEKYVMNYDEMRQFVLNGWEPDSR